MKLISLNSPPASFAPRSASRRGWALAALLIIGLTLGASSVTLAATRLRGDVDQNGTVSVLDAIMILREAVGVITFDADQTLLGDVNADGKINTNDAILTLRRSTGLVGDLGVVTLPDASTVSVSIINNETRFEVPGVGQAFGALRVTQGTHSVTTASSALEPHGDRAALRLRKAIQYQLSDRLIGNDYAALTGFTPSLPARVEVLTAPAATGPYAVAGETEVIPLIHAYDLEVQGARTPELTLISPFPDTAHVGDTVTLTGHALVDLRADAFVVPPHGFPVKVALQSVTPLDLSGVFGATLPAGSDFTMTYRVSAPGLHTVEINNYPGSAALNRAFYVGPGIPLLAGPLDSQTVLTPGETLDVAAVRSEWFARLNADRATFGLSSLTADERLQAVAQAHTDEMVTQGYFGHVGLDGSTPGSRAQGLGIPVTSLVGENLSQGFSAAELEAGLMASAVHRENILNGQWSQVGLGVGLTSNATIYGEQTFEAKAGAFTQPADYFPGVTMDRPIPTSYAVGRPVTISGQAAPDTKTVLFFFVNPLTKAQALFPRSPASVDAQGRFAVDVQFGPTDVGDLLMGVSINGSTRSKATYVRVGTPLDD